LKKGIFRLTYTQIIAVGFAAVMLLGGFLLTLPVSSATGEWTGFADSLFTATSATCVTGLIVFDTYTHWSLFGKIIIITMIQIGGIGFMTVVALFAMFLKKQISLSQRKLLMQSAGTMEIGSIVQLVKKIAVGTFAFEAVGAVILSFTFCPMFGTSDGIFTSIFISISAFCNAGFDLLGRNGQFSSLTSVADCPSVIITITLLIIIGGLGFLVWSDIAKNRFNLKKYSLHSKIVLTATTALIVGGTVFFFITENNAALAGMSFPEKLLHAFFLSASPRTAGFNAVDLGELSQSGKLMTIVFMLIGGSPGSTAGGIKTTTIVVLVVGAISFAKGSSGICIFKRRLDDDDVKRAAAILSIYIIIIIIAVSVLCMIEPFPLDDMVFEVASAVGTVGLTLGITPSLSLVSKIILIILMFGGRIGALSLAMVLAEKRVPILTDRPVEKILIG